MLHKALIGAGLTFCLVACASTPSTSGVGTRRAANSTPPPGCVADTATRIPLSSSDCSAFGRVYTQQDIKKTGSLDSAQALRLLDPAVTTSGAAGQ